MMLVCRSRSRKDLGARPLVIMTGSLLPLVEGCPLKDDYYWKDDDCSVIAFGFTLQAGDSLIIIYRDSYLSQVERLEVEITSRIPPDTPFNVRTGELK